MGVEVDAKATKGDTTNPNICIYIERERGWPAVGVHPIFIDFLWFSFVCCMFYLYCLLKVIDWVVDNFLHKIINSIQ